ncbi:SUMF1/EgtB/PvdO family nonheme iron enzyme [Geobacillus stearothermophilus]|uniref:SUMF1/EgtB/PvdO family nonheme iron enzyme n=1 Tax=Geobacillus stearothermophilus TaxID=1422 RepID=UPI002E214797|nr:SUMF1/EgtB/PvdO family nonheme iron enzyme [Geobacillus stearothermophilus]MED3740102.1 SUMF1/EgtB/PvdO family nonheme iron enzyme [Geobacillus stearothermophilus]MED3765957.1 SUMF1/EgtB/PvdO family nonheme iron enzyme [Geobacillus stearothermophilus]MED3773742.1 SUMF1/EgtB/PvdO family nonheme iron enzyme [Geobacillus stearothermophilus]
MPFVFSIKDTYRQAVEAQSGGRNTVMYDNKGNPSIMVRIPKFYLDEVITGAPHTVHPAFIVNGVEKSEIWVSKYQNIIHDGRAYSVPGVDPATNINFDTARAACFAKGNGWHLMTNAEWAAIALWARKNGTMPRGNTNNGASSTAPHERGVKATTGADWRTLTGSGPMSWNHDNSPWGISDLCGNVWEWVDGLKLVNGKIYVHNNNDFNTGNAANNVDGWVDTLKYFDNTSAGDATQTSHDVGGDPVLSDDRTYPMYTGGDVNDQYGYSIRTFESLTAETGVTVPDLLKHLAIFPVDNGDHGGDILYVRNYGERLPVRGGDWGFGSFAGVFALNLSDPRSHAGWSLGFRSAYVSI